MQHWDLTFFDKHIHDPSVFNFTDSFFLSLWCKIRTVISIKAGAPSQFLLLLLFQVFHSRKPFSVPGGRIHCRKLWNPVCPWSDESTLGVCVSVQSLLKLPEAFHIFCPAGGKTAASRRYVKIPLELLKWFYKQKTWECERQSKKLNHFVLWEQNACVTRCVWTEQGVYDVWNIQMLSPNGLKNFRSTNSAVIVFAAITASFEKKKRKHIDLKNPKSQVKMTT